MESISPARANSAASGTGTMNVVKAIASTAAEVPGFGRCTDWKVYMKTIRSNTSAVLIGGIGLLLLLSCAQPAGIGSPDRAPAPTAGTTHRAPLREVVTTTVADVPVPNLPGKRFVSRVIDYPPGGGLPAHRHAPSAFIYAHVLSGAIRSKVDDEPARLYRPGETWLEKTGVHHQVSVNASDTEPARLLAVLIVDAADEPLTIPDPQ